MTVPSDLQLQATRRTNLGRSRLIVCLPAETSLASKRLDRGLSAILAADVAGYSQLVGAEPGSQFGERGWGQRSRILYPPIPGKVSEHDVECERERTCILASNQVRDIG